MKRFVDSPLLAASLWAVLTAPALAGTPTPAPVLAAGPVGLGILAAAGVGYVAVRAIRNRRR